MTADGSSGRATPPRSDVQRVGWPPSGATPAQSGQLLMRAVEAPRTRHRLGRAPGSSSARQTVSCAGACPHAFAHRLAAVSCSAEPLSVSLHFTADPLVTLRSPRRSSAIARLMLRWRAGRRAHGLLAGSTLLPRLAEGRPLGRKECGWLFERSGARSPARLSVRCLRRRRRGRWRAADSIRASNAGGSRPGTGLAPEGADPVAALGQGHPLFVSDEGM